MSFNSNVYQINLEQVDDKGRLLNQSIPFNKPILIMIHHSSNCKRCLDAIPEYNKFALTYGKNRIDKNNLVFVAHVNNTRKIIDKINPDKQEYPHYVLYYGPFKYLESYAGDISVESLRKFINTSLRKNNISYKII